MTFKEQQKRINKCYAGYYNDGVFVGRSFMSEKTKQLHRKVQKQKSRVIKKLYLPL